MYCLTLRFCLMHMVRSAPRPCSESTMNRHTDPPVYSLSRYTCSMLYSTRVLASSSRMNLLIVVVARALPLRNSRAMGSPVSTSQARWGRKRPCQKSSNDPNREGRERSRDWQEQQVHSPAALEKIQTLCLISSPLPWATVPRPLHPGPQPQVAIVAVGHP